MKLSEVRAGEKVFIDSKVFIYHFTGVSEESTLFLRRCEEEELTGLTGINIVIEVLHRLMMIEAVTKELVQPGDVAKKLRNKPEIVKQLKEYETNTLSIMDMGIEVLSLSVETIKASLQFRRESRLFISDSLTVAMMDMENIINLATLDKDFTRIEEINVYSPDDIV